MLVCSLPAQDDYKFGVRSNLVFLPTRVETRKGETIYGLTSDQFVVEDNGVRQSIRVDEPDSSGLSLVVVIQCSMSAPEEFSKLKGLGAMIEAIAGGAAHEVAVVSFGEQPYILSDFSRHSEPVRTALARLKPCGEYHAASIDAVSFAINMLKHRANHNRRAIVLVSETRDHGSRAKLNDVVAELGVTDTVIYSVAFSPTRDQFIDGFRQSPEPVDPPPLPPKPTPQSDASPPDPNYVDHAPLFSWPPEFLLLVNALRRNAASGLASLSGGEYINFTTQKGFDNALARISNQIHNYYLLSFQPPSADASPAVHNLRVRIPDHPEAVIQTRKSYWSGVGSER